MLKNPHVLEYDRARVELLLRPAGRGRFVMWSAPLLDMYPGDYHFKGADGQPRWGDVAMNYFQQVNPHYYGSEAQADMFTATFGEADQPLGLGKAFNLKVMATGATRDSAFIFPRTENEYRYSGGTLSGPLTRTSGKRFITDGKTPDAGLTCRFTAAPWPQAGWCRP
jgi:hypothetical protein